MAWRRWILKFGVALPVLRSLSLFTMLTRVRAMIALVIVGLVISGLTAFPLLHELNLLAGWVTGGSSDLDPDHYTGLAHWILKVREGLEVTYAQYPFIAYGTDWLAFGHLMIALFFVLPWMEPVQYRGVLYVGIVSCILVIPLALICGPIRGIPFYWRLIDCSFGVLCVVPLLYAVHLSKRLGQSRS